MTRSGRTLTFQSVLREHLSRRRFLQGAASIPLVPLVQDEHERAPHAGLAFPCVPASREDAVHVPEGYRAQALLRWGDPIAPDAPPFDAQKHSAANQRLQVGFNSDFNGFFPLRSGRTDAGLLCVNHESTIGNELFPGFDRDEISAEQCAVELAAHGMTIVELQLAEDGAWQVELDSPRNRRITGETPIRLSGPVAGTEWVRTEADPEGRSVFGMLSNCGGGKTPWGTVLTCEENVQEYFSHLAGVEDAAERDALARYRHFDEEGLYRWSRFHERFDLSRHPREANRFGWVVEIDPARPDLAPVKRTALGRMMHEGAATALADDGRVVVYMGDDDNFEYLFKFVSIRPFESGAKDRDLLDQGTLYVARLHADGTGEWLPLVPEGVLASWSLARILVHARLAADLLGATPMDRPEDVEVNPLNHRVYVCLTNNTKREVGDGAANPRAKNAHGHVLELDEAAGDLAATRFAWSIFLFGGSEAECPVSCPDNVTFDGRGNLWLTTDGQPKTLGVNDSLYAIPTAGLERGRPRRFLTAPVGAELCGPELTPDERTIFVNVQHPGAGGGLEQPTSRWPHDGSGVPRSGVVAVRRLDGGPIGS